MTTRAANPHERVHRLWDELAVYEASKHEAAVMHLLRTVAEMIDAQNAYWMGAVRLSPDERDPLLGWRPRILRYLHPSPEIDAYTRQKLRSLNRDEVDEVAAAHARLAGSYRALRRCDLMPSEWFTSEAYAGCLALGLYDSLLVAAPVGPTAEVYYGFIRTRPDYPFTEAERDLSLFAIRGLAWFHRQILLAHGLLVASSPLSPMERRVLSLLLTDRSEKVIAAELTVSPSTVHTYVRDVLRKFGVSGRTGLTALWLGRQA
jgi:DNA-binding CsgD family transcriptional regulator